MSITFEKRPYEEEYEMVEAFFDKYQSLIDDAPENSLLGMIRDLDDAMVSIAGHRIDVDHLSRESENDPNLKEAEEHITHVALILAQMWSDKNQDDIELECVDPATGEKTIIGGKEQHCCGYYYYRDENGYCSMVDTYIKPSDDACGSFRLC